MVKKKANDIEKRKAREIKRKNRLNSLRNEFEGNKIKAFDQVFAIVSETNLAAELNISAYNFRKKIYDPGEFTISEILRFSSLIGVDYNIIATFIMERIIERNAKRESASPASGQFLR